jgi:uncharacterized protein YdaT
MGTKYYDADGNPVENVLSADEANKIAEDKSKTFQEELSKTKEQLAKFENKDFNFKKLRDMSKEEREALNAKEMELLKRQEAIEEQQVNFTKQQKETREKELSSYKEEYLEKFAGNDEEMKKKVLFHFNRLADEAITRSDIEKKMGDAWVLATGGRSSAINPVLNAMAKDGYIQANSQKKGEKLTDDQLDLIKKLKPNLTEEKLKKMGKI